MPSLCVFALFVCLRTSFLLLLYHYHILTSDINVSSHKFYHLLRLTLRRSPSLIALIDFFAYPLSLVSSYQLVFYSSSRYAFSSSPYLRSRLVSFVIVCILCKLPPKRHHVSSDACRYLKISSPKTVQALFPH